ncbi:hypothetical protein JKF63_05808 [Porcisia hertigi]|uniref:FYVE-type domain-containing protein n=1 Tax=Porcisia hertigi TaxID=2761500 RepID=A0A836IJR3_9TRYP|nr:hypothetical protein JKF63_05808 [Porcisia hertigi]
MPSGRRRNKHSRGQASHPVPAEESPQIHKRCNSICSTNLDRSVSNGPVESRTTFGQENPSTSLDSSPKRMRRTASSLAGGDADEEMTNSGGGGNANGVTSASPAPSHSSVSSPSESEVPRAADLLARADVAAKAKTTEMSVSVRASSDGGGLLPLPDDYDQEAERDATIVAETDSTAVVPATDNAGELFYVELDPKSHTLTGVLPEMQRLHVRLMQLLRVLRRRVAQLRVLRERARQSGADLCEVTLASPFPPRHSSRSTAASPAPSCVHRHTDTMTSNGSVAHNSSSDILRGFAHGPLSNAENTSGDVDSMGASAVSSHRSHRQPTPMHRQGVALSSPRGSLNEHLAGVRRNMHQQTLDNDSVWGEVRTARSSRTTTAQSTPSLQPCVPPPSLQSFEEDEPNDDERSNLWRYNTMAARRSYAARLRPDSVPTSVHSTPNMLPENSTPYARSDNGGMLSLPPTTAAHELAHASSLAMPSITVDGALQDTCTLPPADVPPPAPPLTDDEKRELRQLSWRVAELYSRRGLLLQKADRLLCRHAQQHERWEGNEERRGCYRCRRLFSHLTRRHHCRRCGRLCCAECSRYVGKKQDTSYVAAPQDATRASDGVEHRVIIKSEYTTHITAEDTHDLVEECFDEHTYPRRGHGSTGGSPALQPMQEAEVQEHALVLDGDDGQLGSPSYTQTVDAADNSNGRPRQHKWVRVCAPCYQNCLRARRNNVLQHLKSANLCILDDGFYYYHVMTPEELCRLSTALRKPDSFKKQMELMSHVVVERSADYVAAAPGYSAHTLTAAAQHTPDVLRTLGSIGAYAFRSARQTANDYVGGYFGAGRTILPDNHADVTAPAPLPSVSNEASSSVTEESDDENDDDDARTEASLVSVDDACSNVPSPLKVDLEGSAYEDKETNADDPVDDNCVDTSINVESQPVS